MLGLLLMMSTTYEKAPSCQFGGVHPRS